MRLIPLAMSRFEATAVPSRGATTLDPAKTSPSLALLNGGLTVVGSDQHGNAASLAALPPKAWFEVTIEHAPGNVWFGVCNASHFFGSAGAAWGGGDPHVTAIYINSGGGWIAGMGYAMHEDDAGMATFTGARWMVERDALMGADSFGNPSPNGVIRARCGEFVSRDYAAPPGELFAVVGSDPAPCRATLNFGATPPANPITPGYVAP